MSYSHQLAQVLVRVLGEASASEQEQVVRQFLSFIRQKNLELFLPQILSEFERLTQEEEQRCEFTSPYPLDEETKQSIKQAFDIPLETPETETIDESLIGGVVARFSNILYDASLRTKINRLRQSLSVS